MLASLNSNFAQMLVSYLRLASCSIGYSDMVVYAIVHLIQRTVAVHVTSVGDGGSQSSKERAIWW
jgi:hypothetical protein